MREDFIEISELMDFLGYRDERSVKNWCERNNILLLKAGQKKYILSEDFRKYIDNQTLIFAKAPVLQKADEKNGLKSEKKSLNNYYKTNNEIIAKYLSKYESDNKT